MEEEIRRSSRSNKGTHTGRASNDVYYNGEEASAKRARLEKTPELAASEDPENAENEGKVRCDGCGVTEETYDEETDDGGLMIECERCKTWQHAKCMGYRTQRSIPKVYLCNRCEVPEEKPDVEKSGGKSGRKSGKTAEKAGKSPEKAEKSPEKAGKSPEKARSTEPVNPAAASEKPVSKPRSRPVVANPKVAQAAKTRANVTSALLNVIVKAQTETPADADTWAADLEAAVYAWAGATDKRYIEKSRSVMALVKKPAVLARLISGDLTPADLTLKSVEDIDPELKNYAEKVRQESIRRSVLTVSDDQSQRIRRTHKGEEIVETKTEDHHDEGASSLVAKNVDHRKFKDEKSPSPVPENGHNAAPVPALYQLADDDEDNYHNGSEKTEANEANGSGEGGDDSDDGASDDELAYILKAKKPEASKSSSKKEAPASTPGPKVPPTMPTTFWAGEIIFPDVATFGVSAEFVSCTGYEKPRDNTTASFHNRAIRVCKELMEKKTYQIEGRLDRSKADPYLEQIVKSRDLFLIRLIKEHPGYTKVFEYLKSRGKVGVLSGRASVVKDAYLFALTSDSPTYLNFAPITEGLYALYSVKKDYAPVGKSILKKIQPESQPPAVAVANLDSILSKLGGTIPPNQAQNSDPQGSISGPSHLPQKPGQFSTPAAGGNTNNNIHPERQAQTPNGAPQLSQDQMSYLSTVVQQNPHVQSDPQALLNLLQQMQT